MEFEKKFKKKLQRREIKPSSDSWNRLQERLDEDSQPKRRNYGWLWKVAAMAVVFFGLGILVENPFDSPQVVIGIPEEQIPQQENSSATEIVASEAEIEEKSSEKTPSSEETIAEKRDIKRVDPLRQRPLVRNELATIQSELPVKIGKTEVTEITASEELAQITDAEINNLLAMAREDISQDSSAYAAKFPEAEELLQEVEFELEESFRRKVFEVLKEGYSKARTAVANRNF